MKAISLNRLDLFYLTKPVHKGTTTNTIYQVVDFDEDGIIAHGVIQTNFGSMNMNFYLPFATEVEQVQLEDAIL